jgi:hypothetical protein
VLSLKATILTNFHAFSQFIQAVTERDTLLFIIQVTRLCQQKQWFNGLQEVQYHSVYNIQVKSIMPTKLAASAILAEDLNPHSKKFKT